jgi:hypothetical protein
MPERFSERSNVNDLGEAIYRNPDRTWIHQAIDDQQATFAGKSEQFIPDAKEQLQKDQRSRVVAISGNLSVQEYLSADEWWNL